MKELNEFVNRALSAGRTREEVESVLLQAGWQADEIKEALSKYALIDYPIPVPRRQHSGSAREAFLYLVTFTALYISAFSLCFLLATMIDLSIPDPYYGIGDRSEETRWYAASLLVAFPLYVILTKRNLRATTLDPAMRESPVRKWLIAITLFSSAMAVLITLIVFVSNLLGGELGVRSILKILVVLAVSGLVFGLYLWELRKGEAKQ